MELEPGVPLHAFDLHADSGWVFNVPGVQLTLITDSGAQSNSVRKTHAAPSAGATFWVTRRVGVYGDFLAIDGGKVSYTDYSGNSITATGNMYGGYGGIQVQSYKSNFRPYFDVGMGVRHDSLQMTIDGISQSGGANSPSVRAGGGFRGMVAKRWGVKAYAEIYHTWNSNGFSQTYPRVGVGWFFQTKPSRVAY